MRLLLRGVWKGERRNVIYSDRGYRTREADRGWRSARRADRVLPSGGDLDGLAAIWADGDAPSMDNPIGGIRRGWPAIREGYAKLFQGAARVQVAFHDFTSQGGGDWHLFVGREKGVCRTATESLDVRFRTTRWFVRTSGV